MAPVQLLQHQAHVSFVQEETTWMMGHHQAPPYVHVTMRADSSSYNLFRETSIFPQSMNRQVLFPDCVDVTMFTTHNSDVDIITTDTLRKMGYDLEGLLEVSNEGRNLFRRANIKLMGAMFVNIGLISPAARRFTFTKSLVYVARTRTEKNHMSSLTVEILGLRGLVGSDLLNVYIPKDL